MTSVAPSGFVVDGPEFATDRDLIDRLASGNVLCENYQPPSPQQISVCDSGAGTFSVMIYPSESAAASWYATFGLPADYAERPDPRWVWGPTWSVQCTSGELCRSAQSVLGGRLI
ncbi:hypothetical protein GS504_01065 [Rhodococcus hoagii]|nr:hypothetical protein [Prescottella equi]NKS71736.1 hypothetical protein [Prescottella equi]